MYGYVTQVMQLYIANCTKTKWLITHLCGSDQVSSEILIAATISVWAAVYITKVPYNCKHFKLATYSHKQESY